MRKRLTIMLTGAVAALALAGGTAYAAASSTAPQATTLYACKPPVHAVVPLLTSPSRNCPAGYTSVSVGSQAAPAPVPVTVTKQLVGSTAVTEPTGGSFDANLAPEVGTVSITTTGTYMVSLSAKATPRASGDTAQIFPQFFVYNSAKPVTGWAGDLFNVGSGALEPDGTNHDSYYSGSNLLTLTAGTTLHVYAFGYDSDGGAGFYSLDSLTLTAVQVSPAS